MEKPEIDNLVQSLIKDGKVVERKLLDEEIAARDAAKARARELESELSKFKEKERALAEQDQKTKEEQERTRLKEQGKTQELIALTEQKYQKAMTDQFQGISRQWVPDIIRGAAQKAVPNITPQAIEDLPSMLGGRITIDAKSFKPMVLGDDGQPMLDEKAVPVTVEKFLEGFVSQRSYMLKGSMPNAAGAKVPTGKGTTYTVEQALKDNAVLAEWKKIDAQGCDAAFKEYWGSTRERAQERFFKKA